MNIVSVPVHQLKASLSRFLARVRAGDVIEVTSHDKPVARLVGIAPEDRSALGRLKASGAVQWQGGKPQLDRPLALQPGGNPLAAAVLADRG